MTFKQRSCRERNSVDKWKNPQSPDHKDTRFKRGFLAHTHEERLLGHRANSGLSSGFNTKVFCSAVQVDRHGNLLRSRLHSDPTFKKPINSLRHHLSSRILWTYFNNLCCKNFIYKARYEQTVHRNK